MQDDDIIATLQRNRTSRSPVELAELLDTLTEGNLTQGTFVTFFKRAFPSIPLRTLLDAGGWVRLSDGGITDAQFNDMLAPWLEP